MQSVAHDFVVGAHAIHFVRRNPPTVIMNGQNNFLLALFQSHFHHLRFGMAYHIRQSFLSNSEESQRDLRVEPVVIVVVVIRFDLNRKAGGGFDAIRARRLAHIQHFISAFTD